MVCVSVTGRGSRRRGFTRGRRRRAGLRPVHVLLRQRALRQLRWPRENPPPVLALEVSDPGHRAVVLPDGLIEDDPGPLAGSKLRAADELHVARLVAVDPHLVSNLKVRSSLLGWGGGAAGGFIRRNGLRSACNRDDQWKTTYLAEFT